MHKSFSYQFAAGLAIERFDDEAILFVAERDAMITVNRGGGDLFEAALVAFAARCFGRAEALAWFGAAFDVPDEELESTLLPLLAFAIRHGIVVKCSP